MRKSKIIVTLVAVILVGLLLSGTAVFSDQNGVTSDFEQADSVVVDSDGDSLEDGLECVFYGTDPYNADTDGDGLLDCEEVSNGWDPLDPHSPCNACGGIVVDYEQTESAVVDFDGDSLEDGLECVFYGTDPYNPDTDGDGFTDYEEISNGWNPLDPNNP